MNAESSWESYSLVVFSPSNSGPRGQNNDIERVGAAMRVDVGDRPIEVSVPLHRAVDLTGRIEIESNSGANQQFALDQIRIQLTSDNVLAGGFPDAQVSADGTFVLHGVIPGAWRILAQAGKGFLKSAWLGNENVTNAPMDLSSGTAAPLRLVVSTNTATVRGTAPPGMAVFTERPNDYQHLQRVTQVDAGGQFTLENVAPGKQRVVVGDPASPMPEEGGQEITVGEG
jgi:hypothetical protein